MSAADKLLPLLDKVTETGSGKWRAQCPSHQGKSRSLAIREIDDRLLIHCFAGCDVHEVVSAAGLELSDLFEATNDYYRKNGPPPRQWRKVCEAMQHDATVIALGATTLIKGDKLGPLDEATFRQSIERLQRIAEGVPYEPQW